jgi:hypothetical protein
VSRGRLAEMPTSRERQMNLAARQGRPGAFLAPRLEDVLFVAILLLVVMLGPRLLNVDGDLGRHLTIGEHILQTGRIPTADVFSHTMAGERLTPHEWLAQVAFALAYRILGLDGVVLLCALVLALTFWLTYRSAVRRSGLGLAALALVLLAASASSLHWLARPHLFTLLLVVAWTDGLENMARGERVAWWRQPLIMLAWANLHGAFVIGFVVWLAYVADWAWRRLRSGAEESRPQHGRQLILALVLSLAATLVNPAGMGLWATSMAYVGNAYLVGHTAEYLSPNFHDVSTWPFLLMILVSPVMLGAGRRRLELRSILLLIGWTGLGLYSVRHVPVYAVLAAPILAEALAAALPGTMAGDVWLTREARLRTLEAGFRGRLWPAACSVGVALLLASGVRLTPVPAGNSFSPSVFPVQAMDWVMAESPGRRVFNYFPWGGYLLFRAWPEVTVFIDGQTDFYGEALTRRYETVITLGDGWEQVLARYDVDWVIMPSDSRLTRILSESAAWTEAYADRTTVILRRTR